MESWMRELPTPCYAIDERRLYENLRILRFVINQSGCKILLAQKAFSMFQMYPLIAQTLCGTSCSGLFEAMLGAEFFQKENHVYSPAYKAHEFDEIVRLCSHVIFNTPGQFNCYADRAKAAGCSVGLRLNPECSTQDHELYDPCAPNSRLGTTLENFEPALIPKIDGFHIHTLCEQNADALLQTVSALESQFGLYLRRVKWLNLGGGHHITRQDYDMDALIKELIRLRDAYDLQVYLEPGEAVVLNAGYLVASVMDIMRNGMDIAILDASATCHMPDVLEMPYRPDIIDAGQPGFKPYTYRLSGPTCLAGDVIGDYSFDSPLTIGQKLVFCDMAHYTMVKNNTFNGIPLPHIAVHTSEGQNKIIRSFVYEDFRGRLS
jgi:carboxynorspermidine decarboxylase